MVVVGQAVVLEMTVWWPLTEGVKPCPGALVRSHLIGLSRMALF